MKRTKMPKLQNGSKGDSNPGSIDCESGILQLSYHAVYVFLPQRLPAVSCKLLMKSDSRFASIRRFFVNE